MSTALSSTPKMIKIVHILEYFIQVYNQARIFIAFIHTTVNTVGPR